MITLRAGVVFCVAAVASSNVMAACGPAPTGWVAPAAADLLSKYPDGGGALTSDVRNMVMQSGDTAKAITGLADKATPAQRQAIGAGLGQAAQACLRTDQAIARSIQEAIVGTPARDLVLAYSSITGDRSTAATGGGFGGGGGSLGGGGLGATAGSFTANNAGFFAASTLSTPNTSGTSSGGSAGSIALGSRTFTSAVTPAASAIIGVSGP